MDCPGGVMAEHRLRAAVHQRATPQLIDAERATMIHNHAGEGQLPRAAIHGAAQPPSGQASHAEFTARATPPPRANTDSTDTHRACSEWRSTRCGCPQAHDRQAGVALCQPSWPDDHDRTVDGPARRPDQNQTAAAMSTATGTHKPAKRINTPTVSEP